MMDRRARKNGLILEIRSLRTYFRLAAGTVRAVDGVTLDVQEGSTLGIVGESGCGKTMTALSIMRLVPPPGEIEGGQILFHRSVRAEETNTVTETIDLASLSSRGRQMCSIRGDQISMVFQEPMTAMSPVRTVKSQIVEVIVLHQGVTKTEARDIATDMLARVKMPEPKQTIESYPFQLSGGMRQRALIAMALSCQPSLLIADEPTTALDVTTEAQILDLLRDLQEELGMAIMYITHDLGVIAEMAEEVAVMYMGRIVERAEVQALYFDPKHPYTQGLLKSIPRLGTRHKGRLSTIKGVVPDPYNVLSGCLFHPRCPDRMSKCEEMEPEMVSLEPSHLVRCHLYNGQA